MMPTVTTSAMQKSVSGCLVIALFCLFLSTGPRAQTDTEAKDVATSLAVCKAVEADVEDGDENEYRPCEQYIDANTEDSADTIKWIIEEIDERKKHAQEVTSTFFVRDEIVHWILVILSLLTTISTVITKVYPKLNVKELTSRLSQSSCHR
jgi:hypothetical protein